MLTKPSAPLHRCTVNTNLVLSKIVDLAHLLKMFHISASGAVGFIQTLGNVFAAWVALVKLEREANEKEQIKGGDVLLFSEEFTGQFFNNCVESGESRVIHFYL